MVELIRHAFNKNNLNNLSSIVVDFSNDLEDSIIAQAQYYRSVFGYQPPHSIVINNLLWDKLSSREKEYTIIHETCHLIAWMKFGEKIQEHGNEWKSCMYKAGLSSTPISLLEYRMLENGYVNVF